MSQVDLTGMLRIWASKHDPGLIHFRRAARAALVMPIVFFAIDTIVHKTSFSLFAAFGSLATLFLVSFSGSRRDQLIEAGGLLLAQLFFICLGTAVSTVLWLAVPFTVLLTLVITLLSIQKPSVSKAITPILVSFIMPITSPASVYAIPERLLAWSVAGSISLFAIVLLWPVTSGGAKDEITLGTALKTMRNIETEIKDHPELYEHRWRPAIRTSLAVGMAVLIANLLNTQHSFWVILGTLTVLCFTSLKVGQKVIDALIGTVIGIVLASVMIALIGPHTIICWVLLPVAILFAGIAPATISFVAGQVGFTALWLLISNITTPIGWRVGLIRLEDVLIGCAVSVLIGSLFWTRRPAQQQSKLQRDGV